MTKISLLNKLTGMFRRSGARSRVCLEVRPDGVAWAVGGTPGVDGFGFAECLPAKRQSALRELVEEHGWAGAATTLVLPLDQYQVFQMDRPEGIEESELADALKWKLKDFLGFSPSEAVSDVFPFPEDASRGRGELVNVVAARRSLVSELVTLVQESGLELDRIDIAELALRNLVCRLDDNRRGAALVHLKESYGQMVICKGNTLYLSRRLEVTSGDLRDAARQESAVQSLALEMQRSLDYYESQLGQVPPARIRLVARYSALPLASMLSSYVSAGIETLDWGTVGLEADLDSRCLPAWSAGLPLSEVGHT
ncbi:biogenesis protein MshI [Marinobacter sp. SS8-8]|uniref:biogenesis protein MshI n=1 Tax=Marinobacter sp. SS8-8 TaxID=3050452 RepID=UPI0026E0418F|nr:biogenesis protein MshI [Marinobacter sp. SS8-8]|tara:strand:+ start:2231 stop:3163 length:933 start_codon:yes stop_codon:yes gene_type:complete